jgi:hypothetical protein
MTVLLDRSEDPSVSGWYAVNILNCTSNLLNNSVQNLLTNSLSLSEVIAVGRPNCLYNDRYTRSAISGAVAEAVVGSILT